MKRNLLILCSVLALSACRFDEYYAEGASIATRDSDVAACNAIAIRQYPIAQMTRYTPQVFHPARETCNSAGICRINPPYWSGGDPYTVDVNEDRRTGAVRACMADRGYTLVSLPRCDPQGTVAASTIMAPLTAETCLIPRQSGGSLVVNP